MSGEKSGNYGTGKEDNSWPCIRERARTKGKQDANHSISDRLLETAVEAHIKAQSTKPKGFSTAPQFTKMVNFQ
jgi:hypothetical protein